MASRTTSAAGRTAQTVAEAINVAVLRGDVLAEPSVRELADGSCVTQFDLTTVVAGRRRSVPISWWGDHLGEVAAGEQFVVTGAVERRFFRAGGMTQSRTEVVATEVVPIRRRAAVRRAVAAVLDAVHAGADPAAGAAR